MKQYWVLVDGFQTRILDAGSGQPILVLHGLGARADRWIETMRQLEGGYRVVAMDLPGHGFADKDYDYVDLDLLKGAVKSVITELRLENVWIVGTSLGGLIAAHVLDDNPGLVSRVTLVGSLGIEPLGRDRAVGIAQRSTDRSYQGVRAKLEFAVRDSVSVTSAWVEEEMRINNSRHSDRFFAAMGEYFVNAIDCDAIVKEIVATRGPDLFQLIWGSEDRTTPVQIASDLAETVDGLELQIIEDACHMPYLEQPHVFVSALLAGVHGSAS